MARSTTKNLREVLAAIEAEIASYEEKLEPLRRHAQSVRDLLVYFAEKDSDSNSDEAGLVGPRTSVARTGPQDAKFARNQLWEILDRADGPMHARDLYHALQMRGIEIKGKDPLNNVRAHLSHDPRFRPVGRGEWDLVTRADRAGLGVPSTSLPGMASAPSKSAGIDNDLPCQGLTRSRGVASDKEDVDSVQAFWSRVDDEDVLPDVPF